MWEYVYVDKIQVELIYHMHIPQHYGPEDLIWFIITYILSAYMYSHSTSNDWFTHVYGNCYKEAPLEQVCSYLILHVRGIVSSAMPCRNRGELKSHCSKGTYTCTCTWILFNYFFH